MTATSNYYVPQGIGHTLSIAQTLRPTHGVSRSQSSAMSSSSTTNLVPHEPKKKQASSSLFSCGRRKQKTLDAEKDNLGFSTPSKGGGSRRDRNLMMGWKLIFLGSCTRSCELTCCRT